MANRKNYLLRLTSDVGGHWAKEGTEQGQRVEQVAVTARRAVTLCFHVDTSLNKGASHITTGALGEACHPIFRMVPTPSRRSETFPHQVVSVTNNIDLTFDLDTGTSGHLVASGY
jgi:hypothetical protein